MEGLMKTLVVNIDKSLEIREIPKPQINKKQALVKMIACGMCGTDVKLIHQTFKGFPRSVYPIMLGHEGVGEVVEIGADVKGLKKGDRVLLPFIDPDEGLFGKLGSGWGAMSEYGVVHDVKAYNNCEAPDCAYAQTILDDDIDPVDAVMIITFREVLSNMRYFGIKPDNSVVVFGCGPVGTTFIKFLSLLGVKDIIAVDIFDYKLEYARTDGAIYTINSKSKDLTAEVRKIFPKGVDFVLDAVGAPSIATQAMPLIRDRGTVLCYGVPPVEEITIDFSKADYNWNLVYQQMPRKKEEGQAHAQILEWMRSGKINIKSFISDYFEFEHSVEAYKKFLKGEVAQKGIIKF